jgi:hypothetical protein
MALFKQIIQTNPKAFFDVKRNALKCLTVIFRDFINYSRDCINTILEPSWKLLKSLATTRVSKNSKEMIKKLKSTREGMKARMKRRLLE